MDNWWVLECDDGYRYIVKSVDRPSEDEDIELLGEDFEVEDFLPVGEFSIIAGPLPEVEAEKFLNQINE